MNSGASTYLAGQTLGNARMSQLAMIETSDSVSPDCLTAVGQYRQRTEPERARPTARLLSQQFDDSDSTNSEVEQLNLLNAAEAQKMAEMQSQGTLQACLASQMTVANMQQRNAAVEDLNTAAFVSSSAPPMTPVPPTKATPGRPTFPNRRSNAERDQHEDPACNPCGADRYRRRRVYQRMSGSRRSRARRRPFFSNSRRRPRAEASDEAFRSR